MNTAEIRHESFAGISEQLEAMIDAHGIHLILTGLEIVCGKKAAQWQDNASARAWDAASRRIGNLARQIDI